MAGDEIRETKGVTEGEGQEQKKKLHIKLPVPAGFKGMADGLFIVLTPFVVFVVLFLYTMGFIPPQPVVIEVAGDSSVGADSARIGEAWLAHENLAEPVEATEPQTAFEGAQSGPTQAIGDETGTSAYTAAPETVYVAPPELPPAAVEGEAPEARDKKIKQLAKVYERMNASSVASIVTMMSNAEAVEILARMNPRHAAKVLATLDPEKAAELSLLLTKTED